MQAAQRISEEAPELPPEYRPEDLMQGGRAAWIRLGDRLYTLRVTRAGKLILTR